jgi:hypothetical protein
MQELEMKNRFVLVILAFLVQATFAQDPAPIVPPVSETSFSLGLRASMGISQFRHHEAIPLITATEYGLYALKLNPSIAASIGLAAQIGISKYFAFVPELQYSLYSADNEVEIDAADSETKFNKLYHAGVYMHALELPVLARINFGLAYMEFGPQIGFNCYSMIYTNADYYRPNTNVFAFGVAGGAGVSLGSGVLIGIRGYSSFLEYAEDAKGFPWSIQLGITSSLSL